MLSQSVEKDIHSDSVKDIAMKAAERPFGLRDKIGYMFGDLGNCFILALVNGFLMIYYTNVLGISGAIVGTLFLLSRIIDAFADVTIGRLCDLSKLTAHGRFKPWMIRMKYPFCLITIVLFLPFVHSFPMMGKIVYVFVSYIVYGILLSTINIPYGSMAAAISSDPNHRVSLSTFRSVGSAIGGATTGFMIPILIYTTTDTGREVLSGERFLYIAILCAVIAFIAYNITTRLTTERVITDKREVIPASTLIKSIFKDRAVMSLVLIDLFIVINQQLSATNATYLFNDYFKNKQALSIALLFTYGTVACLAPFATMLTKRFGKKEASVCALLFSAVMYLIMYFMHITNPWLYLVLLFIATLGAGLFNLMVWAFITDVIDYHQYSTGLREDGTVYGVNSFARKVAQAVSGSLGGYILAFIGYQTSTTGGAVQTESVRQGVYAMANLIPVVTLLVAAVIMIFFYPLNKKKTEEMAAVLKKINAENN